MDNDDRALRAHVIERIGRMERLADAMCDAPGQEFESLVSQFMSVGTALADLFDDHGIATANRHVYKYLNSHVRGDDREIIRETRMIVAHYRALVNHLPE